MRKSNGSVDWGKVLTTIIIALFLVVLPYAAKSYSDIGDTKIMTRVLLMQKDLTAIRKHLNVPEDED